MLSVVPRSRVHPVVALPLCLAVVFACTPKDDHSGQDSAVEPRDAGDDGGQVDGDAVDPACGDAHATAIRTSIEAQCDIGDGAAPPNLPVVALEPRPAPVTAVRITLPVDGNVNVQGLDVMPGMVGEELARAADRARQLSEATADPHRAKFALAVSAQVPRDRVSATLGHLEAAGFSDGFVLLTAKDKATLPKPPDAELVASIIAEAKALPPDQKAVRLAERINELVADCVPAQNAFVAIAGAAADQKCKLMAAGIAEAMVECGCPEQETEILSMIYAVNLPDTDGSMAVAIPVRLDGAAPLPTGATWQDIATQLEPATEPLVLGTKG